METKHSNFDEHHVLHKLKHHLPAQAPLKDFIHHNTLHSFQHLPFHKGIRQASEILGYKVSLSIAEFRKLYNDGHIADSVFDRIIRERKGDDQLSVWKAKVLTEKFEPAPLPRIGSFRANWKRIFQIDLDSLVQPILFRILCGYLDQGIAIWNFPIERQEFLSAIKEMERNSFNSFFRNKRARNLLLNTPCHITDLLKIVVGDESLYEHYLFDQQFAHQGWSGLVSTIEDQPGTLLNPKKLSFHDLVAFELLLEIDALDSHFGESWSALALKLNQKPVDLFAEVIDTELNEALTIWQEAFEWTYYDQVLAGISVKQPEQKNSASKTFQAMFCIDDRECSLRRYLEKEDPSCETYGTPGFFSVEFYYRPVDGLFYTKVCPAPVTPKYLIKEEGSKVKQQTDIHFSKHTHSFYGGWIIAQTLGFWSAVQLFFNIFRPTMTPATASSFKHMHRFSKLTIENKNIADRENDLQVGFTIEEMANRVEALLKSIGLIKDFAPIVYVIGHGSSSVNNPHYAAYDCGACSGRAGSVNSRAISYMANHLAVRELLVARGITIPKETQFVGGLHDTTRDEVDFYDEDALSTYNVEIHRKNKITFEKSLDNNAKERSRRFVSINTKLSAKKIHEQIRTRSVSLFEPRPELNHATNALCIVGRRSLSKSVFLDRRSFLNSYDYRIDPDGSILTNIVRPLGPVCGGINLEYFFSRVDNQKLGAGTKLPHNVMGLFGVANGIDGDLRPGLPSQMIEVHDPVRLLIIIESFPNIVLQAIQNQTATYEWFINEWVKLVVVNPETHELLVFKNGTFASYGVEETKPDVVSDLVPILESHEENLPVYLITES